MIQKLSLTILFALALGFSGQLAAQDDFDISLPGDEVEVTTPSEPAASSGGASTGEVNLLEMIRAGGWSMWVLGTFSVGVIGLLIYCLIDLQRKNFHPESLVTGLQADMQGADLESASHKAASAQTCLGGVMHSAIHFIADRGYEVLDSEKLEEAMSAASRKFNRGRVRTINYFSVIAQAAPMMGLLGTVSGMIGAFAKLSQGGTGDPSAFAGNISEALITTATGLVVALPAIFCYFIFRDRLQQLVAETDEAAEELIGTLRRTVMVVHEEG
ncbi:MAG: MotA/TolQ/ExbB proton channel family protein [Verrucomicrobiota bacterium]